MSDLIERLREKARHLNTTTANLIIEAADELSRLQSLSDQNRLTGGWRDEDMAPVPRADIEKFYRLSDPCSRIERPRHNLDQVGEWLCSLREAPPLPLPGGEEKR